MCFCLICVKYEEYLLNKWSPEQLIVTFPSLGFRTASTRQCGLSARVKGSRSRASPASLQSHRPIHLCRCMGCSSSKNVLASPEVSERLCSPDGSNLRPTLSAGAVLSFFPETNKTCFSILLGLKYLSPFFTGQKGGLLKPPKEGNHYRALQK